MQGCKFENSPCPDQAHPGSLETLLRAHSTEGESRESHDVWVGTQLSAGGSMILILHVIY